RLRRAHPDLQQLRLNQPRRRVRSVRVAEDGGNAGTKKAAGGVLTAKQAPAGPAPPRRPVCAPGRCCRHSIADQPGKGEWTMSFNNDGTLDLGVVGYQGFPTPEVAVLLGNGDGSFSDPITSVIDLAADSGYGVATDINGNGKLDMVVDGWSMLGDGSGHL